ncbi:Thiamine pyrophosphate protein domain protein TPP-binding protein OS=Tsukamurella paurometabola (strain ATCC 8368 / DSM / CCUG 35730 / CIP 100753 / JCM 10117 / KCTC 9821 / NBRC 16120 / NCIMB 702349 / NCTC 13040)OX=521096 GN=Tpau_0284 PE=3 SV=1 [Tsukamurella paurometabola]|nr:Pyruvate dehydrogenase [ubiquinone] [Tsukamurella paurometabola]
MVRTLHASGVRRMYGVAGDSLNGLTDALRRDGRVEWAHVRNEEAGAFAAGAEAELTGNLSVCVGSCGPGNLHLINGLYDANRNKVPVLAIAAHIPRVEIGSSYFQETHPTAIFSECASYVELVSDVEQFSWVFSQALAHAVATSSVAVVVIPGEIFFADAPAKDVPAVRPPDSATVPGAEAVASAVAAIDGAQRPAILAGVGAATGRAEVLAFAERIKAPIVHSLRAKVWAEWSNPFDAGMTGLLGYDSGYRAIEHCDLLVLLGTDFPCRAFLPDDTPVVQLDARGEHIGRRVPVQYPLVGTVKETVATMNRLVQEKTDRTFLDTVREHYRRRRAKFDALAESGGPETSPLHPQHVAAIIDRLAADDAVFTCDVGTPTVWFARYIKMNGSRSMIGSFCHGSMANALPQAIGAQCAAPHRQVIALCGDGGLSMLMGELLTLRQLNLPVKIFVFTNESLAFVELEMKEAGLINHATSLTNPDFAKVADAAGLHGLRVQQASQLEGVVRDALAYPGPTLVDVAVARQELSIPPNVTLKQAKGFSLYATRTILSGRGDELVDVVKTNLREIRAL